MLLDFAIAPNIAKQLNINTLRMTIIDKQNIFVKQMYRLVQFNYR